MSENEESGGTPGVLERLQNEATTHQRHFVVLNKLFDQSPTGIVEISNELGYAHHELRSSLRVLEEEDLIEPTNQGYVPTDNAQEQIEEYNQELKQLQTRIVSTANEEFGILNDAETPTGGGSVTDTPPAEFLSTEPPEAVTDRFGSFDPLLKHDDIQVQEAAIEQLLEIAEDSPERIIEFTSITTISDLLIHESKEVVRSGFSLLREVVEHDPSIAQPALPVLIDQINNDNIIAFASNAIDLFDEIAKAEPEKARSHIDQRLEGLSTADESKRVKVVTALEGISVTERGPEILQPFRHAIVGFLDDSSEDVRALAASIVQELTESDTVSLDEYHSDIVKLLEDDSPRVRETAVKILAKQGTLDTDTVTTIERLAKEDPNEDVRTTASDIIPTKPVSESDSPVSNEESDVSAEPSPSSSADPNSAQTGSSSSASDSESSNTAVRSTEAEIRGKIPTPSSSSDSDSIELSYDEFQFDKEDDLIGVGGNARVYRAEIPDNDLTIALKQPSFNTTISKDTYDRILKEAYNWSQWDDHPHIVQVLDWGTEPGPWIALEYMDGGTLDEYIGTMSVEQRLWTAYVIGSAVAYANIKGLAHHDIKPNNILFRSTPEGQWDLPKVADWGLSREIIEATGSISQATPDYAAPEHFNAIMPGEPVDERTDIYQLGIICYEILTNTYPNHLRGNVPLPTTVDESLPSSIDNVISKAITQDRNERYEHALVFRQVMEAVLSNEYPTLLDN